MQLDEARAIAAREIAKSTQEELVILDDLTVVKPYGFVFCWQSKRYLETGDAINDMLVGNAPVVVLHDGTIARIATAYSLDTGLALFEEEHGLAGGTQ